MVWARDLLQKPVLDNWWQTGKLGFLVVVAEVGGGLGERRLSLLDSWWQLAQRGGGWHCCHETMNWCERLVDGVVHVYGLHLHCEICLIPVHFYRCLIFCGEIQSRNSDSRQGHWRFCGQDP